MGIGCLVLSRSLNLLSIWSGITVAAGTNEGGNVGPTAIYRVFTKLPLTIPGAHDVHFSNRL
jgi:hypothetical protein